MRSALIALWVLLPLQAQNAAEVRGSVVDALGGESLSNVAVQLVGGSYRATTDTAGRFRIADVAPGDYVLNVSTVGYHLLKRPFHLDTGESKEFAIVLSPDTYRQTDTVSAQASPFETARTDSAAALVLAGNDAKNLASVLADDPLRAVQSLPGVSSNNDFDARFSLRGADYGRIGLYLDGILLHAPFHMLQGQNVQGSATAFNGDMVEEMELHEGAFPERFEDRTAGVLDVHTRDGSRTGTSFRVAASASNAGVLAEGPLGRKKHGSWLVAARKSYLQYIFERTFPNTSFIFGFEDVQGRLTYDLTPKNNITLYVLESFSSLDRHTNISSLGVNSLVTAGYHYTLGNLGWRYTPSPKLLIHTHAAWMREKFDNNNPTSQPLGEGYYGEWVGNTAATLMWSAQSPLDIGVSMRQLRDQGFSIQYQSGAVAPRFLDRFDGTATRVGGFAQQSWNGWSGRVHLLGGVRWDHESIDGVAAISPQASAAFLMTPGTRLQLAWGQYVQYPEVSLLTSILGGRGLLPMRSNHVTAGVEQRVGERTRVRLEYYNRADRDLPFQPLYDPRIIGGKLFVPPSNPLYLNSLRGYSRGVELFVQRSSANRITGWVSYAYGHTGMRDGGEPAGADNRFPSEFDQRHTVNVYLGYRLRPTVNLSVHSSYGSGFPLPGFFQQSGSLYFLTNVRNQLRLAPYSRTDLRVNKSWTKDKWKLTLYGEVVNLTNRTNYIFDSFNGYNSKTFQSFLTLDTMFPILPSAGVVFER
ncbi:MAG TPA: TonB-dependent receptor [Bryobacteraceae bacterium]|nr:TonB-dependent receptor [Bryobacteraceae bacterium]